MIARGLLKEIGHVFLKPVLRENPHANIVQLKQIIHKEFPTSSVSIGCRESIDYLLNLYATSEINKTNFQEYLQTFQGHTRQYARRQTSWYKNSDVTDYVWMTASGSADQKYPIYKEGTPIRATEVEEQLQDIRRLVECGEEEFHSIVASAERQATKETLSTLTPKEQRLHKEYIPHKTIYTGEVVVTEIKRALNMLTEFQQ